MEDHQAVNAYYRTLAEYEQTVRPVLLRLQNQNWALVRELILKHWRRQAASTQWAFFERQNGPEYLAARFDKRRGAYPSRLIYLPHEFYPVRGWCELALDRTRRVPVGTLSPSKRPEQQLVEAETYYRYNNSFARHFTEFGYRSGQPVQAWGKAEVEAAWLCRATDARAFMAEQVKKVARFLQDDEGLQILLESEAPRLRYLRGEKVLLGRVWYFFDCWAKFQEYESVAPKPIAPLPNHAQPKAGLFKQGPTLLSPIDYILAQDFTLEEVDRLARFVGLINEEGHYYLGPRKLGAVVGFILALQRSKKLIGTIPALTAVLAPRWGVKVTTRKTTTGVAQHYLALTNKALARPRTTD